jgi:hypothetical protein
LLVFSEIYTTTKATEVKVIDINGIVILGGTDVLRQDAFKFQFELYIKYGCSGKFT